MFQSRFIAFALAGVLAILGSGCIVSVEPERATNPVGTEHTVTLTLRDMDKEEFCEVFDAVLDDLEEVIDDLGDEIPPIAIPIYCRIDTLPAVEPELQLEIFEVVAGPNVGTNSVFDGVCEPSCSTLNEETSWTYQSNGIPGTDTIYACVNYIALLDDFVGEQVAAQLTPEELLALIEELIVDSVNDSLGSDYDTFDSFFCQTVTKTWVAPEERRPNIGAGLSGLFQGQPTPLPTAAAPAAPSPVIRPPNTGDAGLK